MDIHCEVNILFNLRGSSLHVLIKQIKNNICHINQILTKE
jgi:hypothetical protein